MLSVLDDVTHGKVLALLISHCVFFFLFFLNLISESVFLSDISFEEKFDYNFLTLEALPLIFPHWGGGGGLGEERAIYFGHSIYVSKPNSISSLPRVAM